MVFRFLLGLMSVVLLFPGALGAAEIRHRWVCVDNSVNRLIHVDQRAPERNWSMPIPAGSRDLQRLGDSVLLVSHGNGAAEYDLDGGKRLAYCVDRYKDIQTARRLEDGHTLLASVTGDLYELDSAGNEVSNCRIALDPLSIRLMRCTPRDTLLVGAATPMAVLEVSRSGKVLRTIPLPGKGYVARLLPNGHVLAGAGAEARILEVDWDGTIFGFVGGKEAHPSLELDFCSGWDLLANGNRVMANWQGHGDFPNAPHLVEFSPDNRALWTWSDHNTAVQVTNVLVLE